MDGVAPCSCNVEAVLQGVRIGPVGGYDQRKAGWVKKELEEEIPLFNSVVEDYREKLRSWYQKSR